jgi:hypothetical protein
VWTAALGKILTIDNLTKRIMVLVNWCCMCKDSCKSVDHLLLYCLVAYDFWSFLFPAFGVHWVMAYKLDVVSYWKGCTEVIVIV